MEAAADDDGSRTVECLRGRLLAERVASKAAKEEADHMSRRVPLHLQFLMPVLGLWHYHDHNDFGCSVCFRQLLKLERLLASEIECRNAAERRLKRAMRRLESLGLGDGVAASPELISGRIAGICSAAYSLREKQEGDSVQRKSDGGGKTRDGKEEEDVAASTSRSAPPSMSGNGSCSSVGTALSVNEGNPWGRELVADASRPASASSVDQDECTHSDNYVNDDSLALVPANMWPVSEAEKRGTAGERGPRDTTAEADKSGSLNNSLTQMGTNVYDVLVALRRAKEQLRRSTILRAHEEPLCNGA